MSVRILLACCRRQLCAIRGVGGVLCVALRHSCLLFCLVCLVCVVVQLCWSVRAKRASHACVSTPPCMDHHPGGGGGGSDHEQSGEVDFLYDDDFETDNEFSMILIQRLAELEKASQNLKKKGYYKNWDKEYYKHTVQTRKKLIRSILS